MPVQGRVSHRRRYRRRVSDGDDLGYLGVPIVWMMGDDRSSPEATKAKELLRARFLFRHDQNVVLEECIEQRPSDIFIQLTTGVQAGDTRSEWAVEA
jgi:hypothetical protein